MKNGVCENPMKCPGISSLSEDLEKTRLDYATAQAAQVNTQKSLDENIKIQTQTNLKLVKIGTHLEHLCIDFKEERANNKKGHNVLFERQRDDENRIGTLETAIEKKLGVVNTDQATKLSTKDLFKIVLGICGILTFILTLMSYMGVFKNG